MRRSLASGVTETEPAAVTAQPAGTSELAGMTELAGRAKRRGGPLDKRLVRELPVVRAGVAGLALTSLLGTVATIAQAVLLARIVAGVFISGDRPAQVARYLIWLAVVMGAKAVAAGTGEWIAQLTSGLVRAQMRARLLDAVNVLGPHWLARTDRGQVVTTAGAGIESLDGYVTRALPAVVAASVAPPLVLAAIGFADWPSLLILAVTLPLVPVFLALIGIITKRRMDRQWAALSCLSGQFLDLLEGLTTLKIYGRSRAQVQAVRDGTDSYRRQTMTTLRVAFLSGLVLDLLATLSVALIAVAIGLRLDGGHLSLLRALIVLLLAPEVYAPLRAVGAQHHAAQEGRAVLDTAFAIIADSADDRLDTAVTAAVLQAAPDSTVAQLRKAGFTYPSRSIPALHDVNLDLHAGELMTLAGPSGAGKSTLISLLLAQLTPTAGIFRVREGGSADDATRASAWKASVAWVPQRPRPTCDTVAEEVRLGAPSLSDSSLAAVLARCAAPDAATALGEDGTAISAGQRRRVALARAVARAEAVAAAGGVPVVLADEPTEDLDAVSQAVVRRVLAELAAYAAVVVATHDPVLLALAGREVGVVAGRISSDVTKPTGPPHRPKDAILVEPIAGKTSDDRPVVVGAVEVEAPEGPCQQKPTGRRLRLRAALSAATGARRSLLHACVFGILGGLSGLALTATSVWLICRAAQHPNVQALAVAVVGVRTFALARALLRYAERLAAHDGALRLLAEVRARTFAALEPLAPAGLAQFRRGDLLRRFTTDVDGAQEALIRAVVPIAGALSTAVAATVLVGLVAPAAAIALGAGLFVAAVIIPGLTARTGRVALISDAVRRDSMVSGLLDGLAELDAYGATEGRLEQIAAADRQAIRNVAPARTGAALGVTAGGLVAAATTAVVVGANVHTIAAGHATGILLGLVAVAALVAFDAVSTLPGAYAALGRCWAGIRRVDAVLATPIPVPEPLQGAVPPLDITAVGATGVTIRPAPGAAAILVGADFEVRRGQRVALTGPSGCGKSTLLGAVLRLVPTETHPITLARGADRPIPVMDLPAEAMPPLVAGSLQGDHVFATTLRDNLRVVAPTITDTELDELAASVGLDDWVASLPQRWSTQAGPDGASLSGGQRQRLLLARALLAGPQVLVLDEPTAHLDEATEAAVMADLIRGTARSTVLMSTHHSALLASFDQVLRIEDRQIAPVAIADETPGNESLLSAASIT
jgi:ATP-binding cassette subfamily C protein CydCD